MIRALAALAGNTRMHPADGMRARIGRTAAFGDCKGVLQWLVSAVRWMPVNGRLTCGPTETVWVGLGQARTILNHE